MVLGPRVSYIGTIVKPKSILQQSSIIHSSLDFDKIPTNFNLKFRYSLYSGAKFKCIMPEPSAFEIS
jgi:hypothetical protein